MTSKRASEFPGPYPLQWISDQYCPAVADMGPGLGCIKARGHSPFNIALCPAVVLLAKESDPARRGWQPHPYSNSEPEIEAEPGLTLVGREWRPPYARDRRG
jgi:hypothetical protein